MIVELHAVFRGLVQGVSFRATVQAHARSMHLVCKGRNCNDGSVELSAQGTMEQLSTLLDKLKADSGYARIDVIDSSYRQPSQSFDTFKITR